MSNAIGPSNFASMDRLLATLGTLQTQYSTLQQQTVTGKVATSYAGLGAASGQAISLSAAGSRIDAYSKSITAAQGKAAVAQDVLGQINGIATNLAAQALTLAGNNAANTVDSVAAQARQALNQIGSLLNSQYAGSYVFSGADTSNPPVPAPSDITTSGLYTQIGAQLNALATTPTTPAIATVIANTKSIAGSTTAGTTIFSAYLAGPGAAATPSTIEIADGQKVSLDFSANRNAGATSDPAINGTGSAISDIIRSLSVLANSSKAIAGNPDFTALARDTATTLTSAASTVAQQASALGLTQNTLTAATASQASLKVVLTKQLTGITDADPASTISKLQAVGTQLQASYNVLSIARNLNLASYLR